METVKGTKRNFEATMNFKNFDIIIEYDSENDSDLVRRILMDALKEMDISKKADINVPTFIRDCTPKAVR